MTFQEKIISKYYSNLVTIEAYNEFKNDLFKELEIEDNEKRELFFQKVWSLGHSYGFHEVYLMALDLVSLIK